MHGSTVERPASVYPLGPESVLLAGCSLKNTQFVYGRTMFLFSYCIRLHKSYHSLIYVVSNLLLIGFNFFVISILYLVAIVDVVPISQLYIKFIFNLYNFCCERKQMPENN